MQCLFHAHHFYVSTDYFSASSLVVLLCLMPQQNCMALLVKLIMTLWWVNFTSFILEWPVRPFILECPRLTHLIICKITPDFMWLVTQWEKSIADSKIGTHSTNFHITVTLFIPQTLLLAYVIYVSFATIFAFFLRFLMSRWDETQQLTLHHVAHSGTSIHLEW